MMISDQFNINLKAHSGQPCDIYSKIVDPWLKIRKTASYRWHTRDAWNSEVKLAWMKINGNTNSQNEQKIINENSKNIQNRWNMEFISISDKENEGIRQQRARHQRAQQFHSFKSSTRFESMFAILNFILNKPNDQLIKDKSITSIISVFMFTFRSLLMFIYPLSYFDWTQTLNEFQFIVFVLFQIKTDFKMYE